MWWMASLSTVHVERQSERKLNIVNLSDLQVAGTVMVIIL